MCASGGKECLVHMSLITRPRFVCECVCVEAQVETCIKVAKIKFKFD